MKLHPFRTVAAAMLMTPGVTGPPRTAMPAAVAPVPVAAAHLGHASLAAEWPGPCREGTRGFQLPVDSAVVDHFRPPAMRWGAGNRGWEFGTSGGERVCAVGSGVVTFAGQVAGRAVVSIGHGDGLISSVTGLDSVGVSTGDPVAGGEHLGTARAGLHLGFRLHGEYVDPATLLGGDLHAILVPIPHRAGRGG